MTDAIEKMKEEGWELQEVDDDNVFSWNLNKYQVAIFTRLKPKPNAIVDWESLESQLDDMETGRGFIAINHDPVALATLQSAASDIRRFIKKS